MAYLVVLGQLHA